MGQFSYFELGQKQGLDDIVHMRSNMGQFS